MGAQWTVTTVRARACLCFYFRLKRKCIGSCLTLKLGVKSMGAAESSWRWGGCCAELRHRRAACYDTLYRARSNLSVTALGVYSISPSVETVDGFPHCVNEHGKHLCVPSCHVTFRTVHVC